MVSKKTVKQLRLHSKKINSKNFALMNRIEQLEKELREAETEAPLDVFLLENSYEFLSYVHDVSVCKGKPCTIHNRSNHNMRAWAQSWRSDRGIMERICPAHGVGHPDPDSPWSKGDPRWVHGCCACHIRSRIEFLES